MNVEALISIKGGKGKKKRKNYSTPKKNKHRHTSKKLHALSFYAESQGKFQKIKKTCPQNSCKDRGIVMAHHKNRYYCGHCHFTLMIVDKKTEKK